MTVKELARYFDHTLLKATATAREIDQLVADARDWEFASVCVNSIWVERAAKALEGSGVKVCTVVGFPLGASTSNAKAFEAESSVENGAEEIDMVLSVGHALSGDWSSVEADIKSVVKASGGKTVKVILETCFLSLDQIVTACHAAHKAGANFVKTSTGFGTAGATVEHVSLMAKSIPASMKVKASGGIRTLADTVTMIQAGASRIGASASVSIVQEFLGQSHESLTLDY